MSRVRAQPAEAWDLYQESRTAIENVHGDIEGLYVYASATPAHALPQECVDRIKREIDRFSERFALLVATKKYESHEVRRAAKQTEARP